MAVDPSDCFFRLAYNQGSLILDFSTRSSACTTIRSALIASGRPFDGAMTALDGVNLGPAPRVTCVKAHFHAKAMAVFPDNAGTAPAMAFCQALLGFGPTQAA
jgi:hypothetical protein